MISRSPTDVQPVLDAIVESAARVCGIDDAVIFRLVRGTREMAAIYGAIPVCTSDATRLSSGFQPLGYSGPSDNPRSRRPGGNRHEYPEARFLSGLRYSTSSPFRFCERGTLSELLEFAHWRCAPSPRRRSNCLRPSLTRR